MEIVIADRAYPKHPEPGSAEWLLLHRALASVNYVAVDIGGILRLRISLDQWVKHQEPLEQVSFVLVWPTIGGQPVQAKGTIKGEGLARFGSYVKNLERRASNVAKPVFDATDVAKGKWTTTRPEARQYIKREDYHE